MKRKYLAILVLTLAILFTPASVSARPNVQQDQFNALFNLEFIKPQSPFALEQPKTEIQLQPANEPATPQPAVYTVLPGDNLTKIGTAHNVEWQRLWAKNTQLTHPDRLNVGDLITIPEPSEQLERALPAVVTLPQQTPGVAPLRSYDGSNTYDYGYCTWYVKNRRGTSLPNGLGNANTWYARAAASGMSVGSIPRPGAVGTTTSGRWGHVVYVESVNANGSVNISEMNYKGFGKQSSRTAPASEFVYIY
jgi:surface antigen